MPMTWYDYLLGPTKATKLTMALRLAQCGHARALPLRWARTLGMWTQKTPASIIEASGASRGAYDIFKYRNALLSPHQFVAKHFDVGIDGFSSISAVFIATHAHSRIRHCLSDSIGTAAARAVHYCNDIRDDLGILPAEAILYYYAIEQVFEATGLSYDAWIEDVTVDGWLGRAELWSDSAPVIALPESVFERYA